MHAVRLLLLYDGLTDWLTRNRWAIDCLHATWQNVGMWDGPLLEHDRYGLPRTALYQQDKYLIDRLERRAMESGGEFG
jgi:hypothetical protein